MKYFSLKTPRFLFIMSFLFSISFSFAQQTNGKIKGKITTSEGKPVSGATITLKNSNYKTKTNSNGGFTFNKVAENIYTLETSSPNYETIQQQITVVNNETANVNLVLKFSGNANAKETEEASDKGGDQLDEIIVSASRKVETLSKTPSSVTVINAKDIEDLL